MQKILLTFAALCLLLMASCAGKPTDKLSKFDKMINEQIVLNDEHGSDSEQALNHCTKTLEYLQEIIGDATDKNSSWDISQKIALQTAMARFGGNCTESIMQVFACDEALQDSLDNATERLAADIARRR